MNIPGLESISYSFGVLTVRTFVPHLGRYVDKTCETEDFVISRDNVIRYADGTVMKFKEDA